jgi:hypothetical protein
VKWLTAFDVLRGRERVITKQLNPANYSFALLYSLFSILPFFLTLPIIDILHTHLHTERKREIERERERERERETKKDRQTETQKEREKERECV